MKKFLLAFLVSIFIVPCIAISKADASVVTTTVYGAPTVVVDTYTQKVVGVIEADQYGEAFYCWGEYWGHQVCRGPWINEWYTMQAQNLGPGSGQICIGGQILNAYKQWINFWGSNWRCTSG